MTFTTTRAAKQPQLRVGVALMLRAELGDLGAVGRALRGQLRAKSVDLLAQGVALLFDLTPGRDLGGEVAVVEVF